jgi:Fic family protein
MTTNLITSKYLGAYNERQKITIQKRFEKLRTSQLSENNLKYYISMAAVYSSMIEGNFIDFETYLECSGNKQTSKSFHQIQDLIIAYEFAESHEMSEKNMLHSHSLLSRNIIDEVRYRGQLRDRAVFIYGGGIKVYEGAAVNILTGVMQKFFSDIAVLVDRKMTLIEVFYFASMIHLVFVKIHPFADGNGRSGRLLEKWFIAQKLGRCAWLIPSERLYYYRISSYYRNLNIGTNYVNLNYDLSLPFLKLLPMSFTMRMEEPRKQ